MNTDNTLKFEFYNNNPNINNSNNKNSCIIANGKLQSSTDEYYTLSFFLQPGYYGKFSISYPTTQEDLFQLITYTYSEIVGSEEPWLLAGTPYKLNILQSPGIEITEPQETPTPKWDTSAPIEVDYQKFLYHIYEGTEYIDENKNIILSPTSGGIQLQHNVNFGNKKYVFLDQQYNNLLPFVQSNRTFDGNYHYIYNLGSPLFNQNLGTIKNLGINGVNINNVVVNQRYVDEKTELTADRSMIGALVNNNGGTITNVRFEGGFIMNASVVSVDGKDDKGNDVDAIYDTENIGCIIGYNTGSVDSIALSGNYALNVNSGNIPPNTIDCTVNIGGLVGDNAGTSTIMNVNSLNPGETISFSINNSCQGQQGAYYVGGIAGINNAYLNSINVGNVTVNCSQSSSLKSFIGGIAGQCTADDSGTFITSCNVISDLTSGTVTEPTTDVEGGSYIGGIAGAIRPGNTGNTITVSSSGIGTKIKSGNISDNGNLACGIGGGVGRTYAGNIIFSYLTIVISELNGPTSGSLSNTTLGLGSFIGLQQSNTSPTEDNLLISGGPNEKVGGEIDKN